MQKAVNLSQEKYCSVRHTMRPDLQVNIAWELQHSDAPTPEEKGKEE